MPNTIQTKRSSTLNDIPSAGQLVEGELAVNTNDKKLYSKTASVVFLVGVSQIRGKTASYTLVPADAEQTIRFTGSTASKVLTIPASSTIFPLGAMICVHNDGSVDMTIAITTDTLTWSKDNTTGTRTLAPGATAVLQNVVATSWKISGSALVT